jgi:ferrous iron transport protein B
MELSPYRKPAILRIIHRSLIDGTLFVLGRACITAAPAGALIWLLGNIYVGENNMSLMTHAATMLHNVAYFMGLDGIILLAFIIDLPANEIIVPTIIMGYMGTSGMEDSSDTGELKALVVANNWTLLTAACIMLFALLHYPCATTTWTIWRETRSVKWTVLSNLMPLAIAIIVCTAVATTVRLLCG